MTARRFPLTQSFICDRDVRAGLHVQEMADSDVTSQEEREFQKMLAQIGGQERIYLVGEVSQSEAEDRDDTRLFQDFIRVMFDNKVLLQGSSSKHGECVSEEHREKEKEPPSRAVAQRMSAHGKKRAIDSPVIVFIFSQTFISHGPNHGCLAEILKDVKARTKRASVCPGLVGLVRCAQESTQARQCAQVLETYLRKVFHKHPPEAIWVDCFIPNTVACTLNLKRNLCGVLSASQSADKTRATSSRPLWACWFRRRETTGQKDNKSSQTRQKGETAYSEEDIPMKDSVVSAEGDINV